jgi:hypothetical protein
MKKKKIFNNKCYYLHNDYNLGDNVFNMIFFHIIKQYLENNDIQIYYYCHDDYLNQVREFIPIKNVHLISIKFKPPFSIHLWIGNDYFEKTYNFKKTYKLSRNLCNYNKFYISFFNDVLSKLHLNMRIYRFFYNDYNLIERYNLLNDKYKNLDILVLNSQPYSCQYNYIKNDWDNYILSIDIIFKICTTTKVDNVLSTQDDCLTIKNIAAISTNSKIIIAINSGVLPGLLNEITLKNVKKIYTFDDRCYYSYPNFIRKININEITVNELNSILNS